MVWQSYCGFSVSCRQTLAAAPNTAHCERTWPENNTNISPEAALMHITPKHIHGNHFQTYCHCAAQSRHISRYIPRCNALHIAHMSSSCSCSPGASQGNLVYMETHAAISCNCAQGEAVTCVGLVGSISQLRPDACHLSEGCWSCPGPRGGGLPGPA